MAEVEIHPITKFIEEKIAADTSDPVIFDIKAPTKMSALNADGRYRLIDLKDEEFFVKSIRPGKRSEWIISLKPVSAASYVHVELLDKDMANAMPELEAHLSKLLGFPDVKFRTAVKRWIAAEEKRVAEEQGKVESIKYNGNPHWGSF